MNIVPTWGGSMFEALMVPLFVPEETWGPRSWGGNHPLYVRGQIEHGMDEAGYGYWGFSPSNNPAGGYREYGVDMLGLDGAAATPPTRSGPPGTSPTRAAARARPRRRRTATAWSPRTRRSWRCATRRRPRWRTSRNLKQDFDAYGPGGFYDAVAVGSGTVSKRYLSLDQGMVMAALGNALAGDDMRRYVSPRRDGAEAPAADGAGGLRDLGR